MQYFNSYQPTICFNSIKPTSSNRALMQQAQAKKIWACPTPNFSAVKWHLMIPTKPGFCAKLERCQYLFVWLSCCYLPYFLKIVKKKKNNNNNNKIALFLIPVDLLTQILQLKKCCVYSYLPNFHQIFII